MFTTFAVATLASMASALPAPQAGSSASDPLRFGGLALRSASPIHYASVNANGGAFLLNAKTTTYQPDNIPGSYNNDSTIFTFVNGAGTLGLSTAVPGGQQVYVTEGDDSIGQAPGQLLFTQAHSVATKGNPLYLGFSNVYDATLKFEKQDWVACPDDVIEGAYEVFAASRSTQTDAGCLGFTFKLVQVNETVESAWQYQK